MNTIQTMIRLEAAAVACVAILVACHGCASDGCMENRSSIPLAGFYGSAGTAISLDSLQISGIGAPRDSVLYVAGTPRQSVYLPMRSTRQTTAWQLAYKWEDLDRAELCDTLTFDYDSQIWFASEQCGVIYRYRITDVRHTTHLIDSVAVTDSLVTNVDIERIKIYFRTAAPDEGRGRTAQGIVSLKTDR